MKNITQCTEEIMRSWEEFDYDDDLENLNYQLEKKAIEDIRLNALNKFHLAGYKDNTEKKAKDWAQKFLDYGSDDPEALAIANRLDIDFIECYALLRMDSDVIEVLEMEDKSWYERYIKVDIDDYDI